MNKKVSLLIDWCKSLGLTEYRDEYNNICFGSVDRDHLFHFHEFNSHIDIEPVNKEQFDVLLSSFNLRLHDWYPDTWLILDVDDFSLDKVKEILSLVSSHKP